MEREYGDRAIPVRVGSTSLNRARYQNLSHPFVSVPYHVRPSERRFVETSARSRGFKFAFLSGTAAYLSDASQIIVPESGQGALGTYLVPVGQTYEDYRNHPLFAGRMEAFLFALFGRPVRFIFPRLWHTKGETLAEFMADNPNGRWTDTRSCWQSNRNVSVSGRARQCGICAACLLRRLSVHAANGTESPETYVWENLSTGRFEDGAAPEFSIRNQKGALYEYAIAGVLHLEHLAMLRYSAPNKAPLDRKVLQLSRCLGNSEGETRTMLLRLLEQHETEWKRFVRSLGPNSFVAKWASRGH